MAKIVLTRLVVVLLLTLVTGPVRATGMPSKSTLLGWSSDRVFFATYEDGETSHSGHDVQAVEVHEIKKGKSSLVMRVQEQCGYKTDFSCIALKVKNGETLARAMKRVGPKHRLLRRFKLNPVNKQWRSNFRALGLAFQKAAQRRFPDGRDELSWRVELEGRVLAYLVRGETNMPGETRVLGGYRQDSGGVVLVKLKEFSDGHRHHEYYVAIDPR